MSDSRPAAARRSSEGSRSFWALAKPPRFPTLEEDSSADICVVGGGIAGLTTAWLLAIQGASVILVEKDTVGSGETAHTTAHLSNALDGRYFNVARIHGLDNARLAAESHTAAIAQIEAIVQKNSIRCDFERVDGYLFAGDDVGWQQLGLEIRAARSAGLTGVDWVDRAPIDYDTGRCLRFPGQAQCHPLKYLYALARLAVDAGARIFADAHVTDITDSAPCVVTTESGRIVRAEAVVVATNSPISDRFFIHTKQAAYRSYVVAAPVPRGSITRALYWDTLDPYHYVRLQPLPTASTLSGAGGNRRRTSESGTTPSGMDLLIVGGGDHKTGQEDDPERRYHDLEAWALLRFPAMKEIAYRWSGQVMQSVDWLGFVGRNPGDNHVYIATGDTGMGMTHGTIAGMILSDLLLGRDNPWIGVYSPSRYAMSAVGGYTAENVNVALQYANWFAPGDVKTPEEIPAGDGAVLAAGADHWALYRDPNGQLHRLSAVCPHLGCIVSWNSAEKSWDCPCHGSRFDPFGHVLNGPAAEGLRSPAQWNEEPARTGAQLLWTATSLMATGMMAGLSFALLPVRVLSTIFRDR